MMNDSIIALAHRFEELGGVHPDADDSIIA